jgi:hypothetical protein
MNYEREIESLMMDQIGYVGLDGGTIKLIWANGEMMPVAWYQKTDRDGKVTEFNGKYVIKINYKN